MNQRIPLLRVSSAAVVLAHCASLGVASETRLEPSDFVSPAPARQSETERQGTNADAKPAETRDPSTDRSGQQTDVATLDTIVISGEGGVPLNYAGGRTIVEPETKQKYPDGNVETILRRTPGVYFLPENGNDSRISVGLRGNDPRRSALTALLVDGIPICEAPYGNTDVDGLPIAFERVWRTDVIRGGASIRYGPNSAGGIVNFLTEPIPDRPMLRFSSRIGSNSEYSESLAIGGTWDRFGVLATGVVKGGDGFRDNSDYRDNDGAFKFKYALSESETLSAYVSRFTEFGAKQPGGLTQAAYEADPDQSLRPGADFNFDMNRYVVQYENRIDDERSFEVKTWFQNGTRQLNDFRPIVGPFTLTRVQNSDFDSGALEMSYQWRADWFGLEHSLYHSARYLMETNDEFYVRTPIAGGPPVTPFELDAKFRGRAFSVFTEDVVKLASNLDWGIGFRGESISMTGESKANGNQIVQNYTEILPETNLTWTFAPETAAYASVQQGFYPPQYETGFDPASVLFAPTDPEHSTAYEVGVRSRAVDGLESSVALFDTEFKDKIDFINTPAGKVPINVGHARSYGVELALDYDFGAASDALTGFSAYGNVTSLRSRIEEGANEGNDTPNSPHLIASWGALYEHERSGLWTRVGGSYVDDAFKDPANTVTGTADGLNGVEPSYVLWDAAAGWHQNPDNSGFSVSFGVTNLFDEEYFRRFSTGIFPGAPRSEFAVVTYSISL